MGRNKGDQAILPLRGRCSTPGRSSATACSRTTRSTTSRSRSASTRDAQARSTRGPGAAPEDAARARRRQSLRACSPAALRQGLHPVDADVDGSQHPGAAADAVLPPLPPAHRAATSSSPAAAVTVSTRRRAGANRRPSSTLSTTANSPRSSTSCAKEGCREGAWTISRFKGLGEMSAEQLWERSILDAAPAAGGARRVRRNAPTVAPDRLMGRAGRRRGAS